MGSGQKYWADKEQEEADAERAVQEADNLRRWKEFLLIHPEAKATISLDLKLDGRQVTISLDPKETAWTWKIVMDACNNG